ncbi:MAG: PKD domain-containing protein, partial [Candidatus Thermoplasmatota archaeon]|nr:PKD domain-containing protein [Candidatus Thermoplasmatota archaeon]
ADSTDNVNVTSYTWYFGDGNTSEGMTASHSYSSSGEYTVTLTVEDEAGNTDSDTVNITVEKETDGGTSDSKGISARSIYLVSAVILIILILGLWYWKRSGSFEEKTQEKDLPVLEKSGSSQDEGIEDQEDV